MLDLRGTDFSGKTLKNVDFSGSNLNGVSFKEATLKNCLFAECKMADINFENSYIINTDFLTSEILDVKFQESFIENSKFITQLYYTDFTGAKLKNVNFFDANMVEVNFSNSFLKGVEFEWVKVFTDVDFSNAKLKEGVSFLGTVLNKAIGIKAFTVYFASFPVSYIPELDKVFFTPARVIYSLEELFDFADSRKDGNKKELKAICDYFKKMKKINKKCK
mgnify:CR=1 FL=1